MKRWIVFTLAAGAALLLLTSPLRALGGEEEGGVSATSTCSMGTIWRLTMEQEVGVKFEAEINSGIPDQEWDFTLLYNKHVLVQQTEETEEDGGFEIVKVENNAVGDDTGTVIATNQDTGEVCWGRLKAEI
jgi:hypothetical protein